MFLALRELTHARGRFSLMGAVVALIALLMVMLSGLSAGLVNDGVSGLKNLPVSGFAFDRGTKTDNAFSRSQVDAQQLQAWKAASGVAQAEPVGAGMINAQAKGGEQVDLSLFGLETSSSLWPELSEGRVPQSAGEIVLSQTAKAEGLSVGDVLTVDRLGSELTVVGFSQKQATFGHVDMAFLQLDTWRLLVSGQASVGPVTEGLAADGKAPFASVLAYTAADGATVDVDSVDQKAKTTAMPLKESFNASPGYEAETLTLSMIQVFLYAICALVVGAFFTVWTIQRQHELAVLRAMGSSTGFLLRDSLVQAGLLLLVCTAVGVGVGVGLGNLMPAGMPFSLEPTPILTAGIITIVCGLIGASVATLRVARINPVTALGGAR